MQTNIFHAINEDPFSDAIEPFREIAAYESLWNNKGTSFKKLAEYFERNQGARPSDLADPEALKATYEHLETSLKDFFKEAKPNFLINSTFDYPEKLRDAKEPVELLYYRGNLNLINTKSIAIVGSRKASDEGLRRTKKLVKLLVQDDYTIVSGLAQGIDTQAHTSALENNGRTIAIIGTPLIEYYPKDNKDLQEYIAKEHLLLSQVPFLRYHRQSHYENRLFFPERNKTMSAITQGTVIIEASETSGTLIQARAALYQKRKLFILESNFHNPNITWPKRFGKQGAIRVKDYADIEKALR